MNQRAYRWKTAVLLILLGSAAIAEETAENPAEEAPARSQTPQGVIRLDETVISGNQELPKVLYILPWRDPNGLPEIELDAQYSEMDVFRRLYPPAYRRELTYFESLQTDSLEAASAAGKQRTTPEE
jgi:hypothetical protein